jgi:hypothetical protein
VYGTLVTTLPNILWWLELYEFPTEVQQEKLANWIQDPIAQKAPPELLEQVRDFLGGNTPWQTRARRSMAARNRIGSRPFSTGTCAGKTSLGHQRRGTHPR